jgi:moderate conductance mechanosensitive channel
MEGIDIPKLGETKYLITLVSIRGVKVLVIILVVYIFIRLMRMVSRKIIEYTQDDDHTTQSDREKRAETLAQILNASSRIFAITIGAFMVLRELDFNITPLLTGAGIAGVALGLGAQSIVRDYLNGFFVLMENQFRVGDVIRIDTHEGLVEKITLRTTMLRDVEGGLHIIPNGEIKSVRNLTYGWSQVRLDVGVSYDEEMDRVFSLLEQVGQAMSADPVFGGLLLETPRILGIESFDENQVTIRLLAKTLPQRQWEVARELRRRIRATFDDHGIAAPFPRRVVTGLPDQAPGLRGGSPAPRKG